MHKIAERGLALVLAGFAMAAAWGNFYQCFVDIPGVHFARLRWHDGGRPVFDVASVAPLVGLCAALISLTASAVLLFHRGPSKRLAGWRAAQVLPLAVIVFAWLVAVWDFLSTAGRFG